MSQHATSLNELRENNKLKRIH